MTRLTKLILTPLFVFLGFGLLLLPGALRLPTYKRTSLNGVVSLQDAIADCRRSGLSGWDLVAYAQQLVARKFAIYTTRNLWDSPARAFAHGMGYCTQYNLALKQILDRLGFTTEAVFCLRVQVKDEPRWRMGHTWLRVKADGQVREVCAGRIGKMPGQIDFQPLSHVFHGTGLFFFLSQMGLVLFSGVIEWAALLRGQAPPYWTYYEK